MCVVRSGFTAYFVHYRYLLRRNANVAAVNNDGDLPYDICEDDTMEKLLQECMDEQGNTHTELVTLTDPQTNSPVCITENKHVENLADNCLDRERAT